MTKTARTKSIFRVNTASTFRLSYLVQAQTADEAATYLEQAIYDDTSRRLATIGWPIGEVPLDEWQQVWLGERVVHVEPITLREAAREHVEDNQNLMRFAPLETCILNTTTRTPAAPPKKKKKKTKTTKTA